MAEFTAHTAETAPEASRATLQDVRGAFGFVPNLQANMATSPELLAGYTALWDLFSKTTLTPTEQQVVYLTANFENECHYCMVGHTMLAKMQKIDDAIVQAIRNGTAIPVAKLEALHVFAGKLVRERGFVGDAAVDDQSTPARTHSFRQYLRTGVPGEGIDLAACGL